MKNWFIKTISEAVEQAIYQAAYWKEYKVLHSLWKDPDLDKKLKEAIYYRDSRIRSQRAWIGYLMETNARLVRENQQLRGELRKTTHDAT